MTRDVKESLTAWIVVSTFAGLFWLYLWLIPKDFEMPRWVVWAGFGLNLIGLLVSLIRRRRGPAEKPE